MGDGSGRCPLVCAHHVPTARSWPPLPPTGELDVGGTGRVSILGHSRSSREVLGCDLPGGASGQRPDRMVPGRMAREPSAPTGRWRVVGPFPAPGASFPRHGAGQA